jgi:hypothetical protein
MKDEEGNTLKSCDNHEGLKTLPRNAMECGAMRSLASMPSRNGLARPTCSVSGARDRAWGDHAACTQQNPEVGCARFLHSRPAWVVA